jgi:hypothetical protein
MHILNANISSHPQGDKKGRQTYVSPFLKGLPSLSQFSVGYICIWLRKSGFAYTERLSNSNKNGNSYCVQYKQIS